MNTMWAELMIMITCVAKWQSGWNDNMQNKHDEIDTRKQTLEKMFFSVVLSMQWYNVYLSIKVKLDPMV